MCNLDLPRSALKTCLPTPNSAMRHPSCSEKQAPPRKPSSMDEAIESMEREYFKNFPQAQGHTVSYERGHHYVQKPPLPAHHVLPHHNEERALNLANPNWTSNLSDGTKGSSMIGCLISRASDSVYADGGFAGDTNCSSKYNCTQCPSPPSSDEATERGDSDSSLLSSPITTWSFSSSQIPESCQPSPDKRKQNTRDAAELDPSDGVGSTGRPGMYILRVSSFSDSETPGHRQPRCQASVCLQDELCPSIGRIIHDDKFYVWKESLEGCFFDDLRRSPMCTICQPANESLSFTASFHAICVEQRVKPPLVKDESPWESCPTMMRTSQALRIKTFQRNGFPKGGPMTPRSSICNSCSTAGGYSGNGSDSSDSDDSSPQPEGLPRTVELHSSKCARREEASSWPFRK